MNNLKNNPKLNCSLRVNILGAGKVGKVIARKLADSKIALIGSVLNSTLSHAKAAVDFIGSGKAISSISELEVADIYLITTPDVLIEHLCQLAVNEHKFPKNAIILHCSGTLDTRVLTTAKNAGCSTARIHPIKHMHCELEAFNTFHGVYCVYQGDDTAFETVKLLFTGINGIVLRMANHNNEAYHAAGVLAASYHQILAAGSAMLYESCGIPHEDAVQLSLALAKGAIESLAKKKSYDAFVEGPVKRLDIETILKNKQSITDNHILRIYHSLGALAIEMTKHSDDEKNKIRELFHS